MKILVTGSAGHLGEALVRTLRVGGHAVLGLDIKASPFTDEVGSITDRALVERCMQGVDAVLHSATLHKPHVVTHSKQDFVDCNVTGTLNLLEMAVAMGVEAFVFTSTTSVFGRALRPPDGCPAVWVTEDLAPVPKNIYGITKLAAEGLCERFQRDKGLPCLVLRTSRFFPEQDDSRELRERYSDQSLKTNEYLHRRIELEDVVAAHLCALERAAAIGFARYVVSATTPFSMSDMAELRTHAPRVVARHVPEYAEEYLRRGWRMAPGISRVYVNARAREELHWRPRHDFASVLAHLIAGQDPRSELTRAVRPKGYHDTTFADGPYPVE